jgi:DUF1680 family protein
MPSRGEARHLCLPRIRTDRTRTEGEHALTDVANVANTANTYVDGPVSLATKVSRLSPLPLSGVRLAITGWWGQWQVRNRLTTLPYGISALEAAGNLDNFRRVLGETDAPYRGFVFNDSDIYKTLEALAWSLANNPDPTLDAYIDYVAGLLSKVQADDGYLNTRVQGEPTVARYSQLAESHELYCAGHLFQAAVADFRVTGKNRLLDIAIRFADHLVAEFGAGRRNDYDGHPEVETALVELYRVCADQAYLDLAKQFIDARGRRIFVGDGRGDAYFQDELPIREATSIVGHAVRALYLEAGVVDVAVETGDTELLQTSLTRWADMVASKLYITGGVGSRHKSEGFGDPYELPPDRAYCETCAAIASIQWNWRLLLATGESRFADLLERTVYNGFAASTGADGTSFFYSNPLQVREEHQASDEEESGRRLPWYACACCPPNVMRLVAAMQHYMATTDLQGGVQLHQYTDADVAFTTTHGAVAFSVRTRYPWAGTVEIHIAESTTVAWGLSLRIPSWVGEVRLTVNGDDVIPDDVAGYVCIERAWVAGDKVVLDLEMPAQITAADPRVDAIRGCVAIERGPLVYCIEAADNEGIDLAAVVLDMGQPLQLTTIDGWPLPQAITAFGVVRTHPHDQHTLYRPAVRGEVMEAQVRLTAIPYYLWANRASGPMRVWLPSRQ